MQKDYDTARKDEETTWATEKAWIKANEEKDKAGARLADESTSKPQKLSRRQFLPLLAAIVASPWASLKAAQNQQNMVLPELAVIKVNMYVADPVHSEAVSALAAMIRQVYLSRAIRSAA